MALFGGSHSLSSSDWLVQSLYLWDVAPYCALVVKVLEDLILTKETWKCNLGVRILVVLCAAATGAPAIGRFCGDCIQRD